jgi:glycosyltransferase involved in cell wall biosynthesis
MTLETLAIRSARWVARRLGYSKEASSLMAARFIHRLSTRIPRAATVNLDLCLVIPDKSRGWILEAVCREIGAHYRGRWEISGAMDKLPPARAYFFCHYHFYLSALKLNPRLWDSPCVVWLTHPKDEALGGPTALEALSKARVVTMCSLWRDYAIQLGLPADRVTAIVGAADPDFFPPHRRGAGKIGFCTAYYERKSPQRIIDVIRAMPHRQFILMGRNWDKFPDFAALLALPNFEYREGSYTEYPGFYRELDVFVSLSELEGGPIPLIESMMSNVVPVATRTGFAPDIIRHGQNGYLCQTDAPTAEVVRLIEQAVQNTYPIRETVEHLSWRRFSELMQVELGLLELPKKSPLAA